MANGSAGAKDGSRISLTQWRATGRTYVHRGHPIFVKSAGEPGAEPLLLIHGFPTASWDWAAVWPVLAARFRLYALDMIGFGFSAKPVDYSYSIVDQADLCEGFMRSEGVLRYHVLAHDLGDSVAQELLARAVEPGDRPEVLSAAFLSGGLFPETHRPILMQRLLLSPVGRLVAKLASRQRLAQSLSQVFGPETQPDAQLIDDFWSLIETNNGRAVTHKLIRYIVERRERRERWVGAIERARVPVQLIDGLNDPISGAHMVRRFRELVPLADVTELDRIGHFPQVEAPAAVLHAYLSFHRQRFGRR